MTEYYVNDGIMYGTSRAIIRGKKDKNRNEVSALLKDRARSKTALCARKKMLNELSNADLEDNFIMVVWVFRGSSQQRNKNDFKTHFSGACRKVGLLNKFSKVGMD